MNQTSQKAQIQVRLPGSGELCPFPVDSDTRFRDIFRALIGKGSFPRPQGEHPVWVLQCGDQDLLTWVSEENVFYDRFPFGEPPIASVPVWVTREVHFIFYPDPLARAKAIYLYFEGSKSFMGHEGFLREYKSYQVTPEQEALWQAERGGQRAEGISAHYTGRQFHTGPARG